MTRLWLPAVLHRALLIAAAAVLLMRHGHKGASGKNYNLSPQGFQRALDLASVTPACFGSPLRITTYFLDPDTSKNIRIDTSSVYESWVMGQCILGDATIQGGLIVIFWEHRCLPDLAAGLGWPSMLPIADNDFDKGISWQLGVEGYLGSTDLLLPLI